MIWDKIPTLIWFLIGPTIIAMLAAARAMLKKLGLEFSDAVMWLFTRRVRHDVAAMVNLRRYCKLAMAAPETEILQVPGIRDTKPLKTDEVFVNLRLDSTLQHSELFTNENILNAGNRIRVVGDPGSGKSSLVKRVFRDLCRKAINEPRTSQVPILVELKDLNVPKSLRNTSQKSDWILKYIRQKVAAFEGHRMADFYELSIRQNGVVVLLDGLDEVSTESYLRTVEAIRLLSRRLSDLGSDNIIILTMRVQFYQQIRRDLDRDFPITLYVQPFSRGDIYQFLEKWFTKDIRQANKVFGELAGRPNLRELCTNPLILAMYAAHYQEVKQTDLPDTRAEFYKAVTEELIIKRRSEQLATRSARIARREQRYLIFGGIAYENLLDFSQAANSISWNLAAEAVKRIIRLKDNDSAETLLLTLGTETGIYSEEKPGETLRFIHLTFCEYFAAMEAATNKDDGWTQLMIAQRQTAEPQNRHANARLAEVIPFAAAMVLRGRRSSALKDVHALGDPVLYVRCILETQSYDDEFWPDYLISEREWLTKVPYSLWDEQWLGRLHLYQAALSEARSLDAVPPTGDDSIFATGRLFSDLVAEQRDRLISLFSTYATDDPSGAFELADAVDVDLVTEAPELIKQNCTDPPFLAVCMDRAAHDNVRATSWATIFAEASGLSTSVARTLAMEKRPHVWDDLYADVDRSKRWDPVPGFSKNSMLGSAISLALKQSSKDSQIKIAGHLNRLNHVRSTANLMPLPFIATGILALTAAITGLLVTLAPLGTSNISTVHLIILTILLYMYAVPFGYVIYSLIVSNRGTRGRSCCGVGLGMAELPSAACGAEAWSGFAGLRIAGVTGRGRDRR